MISRVRSIQLPFGRRAAWILLVGLATLLVPSPTSAFNPSAAPTAFSVLRRRFAKGKRRQPFGPLLQTGTDTLPRMSKPDAWERWTEQYQPRSVLEYTKAITDYAAAHDWERALPLVEEMRATVVRPWNPEAQLISNNAAVWQSSYDGEWQKVLTLLEEMRASGVSPDILTYAGAITAFNESGPWEFAVPLLSEMYSVRGLPMRMNFNSVLKACERSDEWSRMLTILDVMNVMSMTPDSFSLGLTISACERARQWDKVQALLKNMSIANRKPNASISKAADSNSTSRAVEFPEWDVTKYDEAILEKAEAGEWERAAFLVEEMRTRNFTPSDASLNAAILSCENEGQWQRALSISIAADRAQDLLQWYNGADAETSGHGEAGTRHPRILFTCTTYLSKPGKREKFADVIAGLDQFVGHMCAKCIIVNEYDDTGSDHEDMIQRYPKFSMIQKNADQRGQAMSLNIILDELQRGGYDYWLQWEEGWTPTRHFLPRALSILMDSSVDQLQFNEAWMDCREEDIGLETKPGYVVVHKKDNYYPERYSVYHWPLFSLQPSLNRASSILQCGRFSVDPNDWPFQFEYDFGIRFARGNFLKAVLREPSAKRVTGHISTWGDSHVSAALLNSDVGSGND